MRTFLISTVVLLLGIFSADRRRVRSCRLIQSALKLGSVLLLWQTAAIRAATIVTPLAAGAENSFFIQPAGSLWGMGDNYDGQLGNGTIESTNRAEQLILSGVTAVAAPVAPGPLQGGATFVLRSDSSLWGTGNNPSGQLGIGSVLETLQWVQIVPIGVIAIAEGEGHTLFVKSDGSLWAMGDNQNGQLGDGIFNISTNRPEEIISNNVVAVACGAQHSLFLESDGSLWGMGDNYDGQLGNGTFNNTATPVEIVSNGVVAIACGAFHSLFIKSDGSLWVMGYNYSGQLGDGTFNNADTPVETVSNGIVAIAGGGGQSLFLKSNGSLWGMGDGLSLGDGDLTTDTPVEIVSNGVVAIASGAFHSLFFKSDGSLWAMGYDHDGELGDGSNHVASLFPEQIVPPQPKLRHNHMAPTVSKVAAGGDLGMDQRNGHSLFIESDGSLWAMGDDTYGQLGDSHTPFRITNRPERIISSGVVAAAAGEDFSLFIKSDGSLWAMGDNTYGQLCGNSHLGIGPYVNTINSPMEIVSNNVVAVGAGYDFSLFLKSDGSLWGMGNNGFGQLGGGTSFYGTEKPVEIVPNDVVAIAAGEDFSLFVKCDGSLWGMGLNEYGQLGNGAMPYISDSPEQIVSNGVVAVAAGGYHSLFIKSDGSLWGMGFNNGELGDGAYTNWPEEIIPDGVVAIAAGFYHSLFIRDDHADRHDHDQWDQVRIHHGHFLKSGGSLWGMGENFQGQLGDGGSYNRVYQPMEIVSNDVVAVAAGDFHSLFVKSDGSLWAMGNNQAGQLGDGFNSESLFPEQIVPSPQPTILITSTTSETNLQFQATCQFGGTFYLLASANLTRPLNRWTPVGTDSVLIRGSNNFDMTLTNAVNFSPRQQFYMLQSP
jgi:alpha-tubulin suppressor-like RCC1 family protein